MMMISRILGCSAVIAAALSLAGCSNWSYSPSMHGNPQSYWSSPDQARAAATGGPSFQQSQVKEYATLADELSRAGDYVDSDYFARKAIKTNSAGPTPPETEANWSIAMEQPLQTRTTFRTERTRLLSVLDGGARDRNPALAARAQAKYDCWMERTEDDWQYFANGQCRKEYEAAMAELTKTAPAAIPAAQFVVYFEFNKSDLTPDGAKVVQDAAAAYKTRGSAKISVTGYTDLVGTQQYNLELSKRRADTVRAALVRAGVPDSAITETWRGKLNPAVPTPDGVREPRNRRVEIGL
jgi:OOP family OmpA-OmpF porin